MDPVENISLSELLRLYNFTKESVNFCDWVHDPRSTLRGLGVEHVLDTEVPAPDGEYYPLGDEEYQFYVILLDRVSAELGDCYPHFRHFRLMDALIAWFSMQVCNGRHKLNAELLACKLMCSGSMREHKARFTWIL